nr:Atrophin-1 multi-domain protein [uncultured Duganella sp.]
MRTRTNAASKFFVTLGIFLAASLAAPARAQANYAATSGWGTFYRPFAASSPWNSRPVRPALGTNEVKKPLLNPTWIPGIAEGAYSTGVFMAGAGDGAVTVYGRYTVGVPDPDSGKYRNITLPHWPAGVVPASGADGHADIVDTVTGIIHSFYQLRYADGKWSASMYSWTRVDGTGWGDPEHWSQGARASGTTPTAGLIRKHEIEDGTPNYRHALALSLPSHTLANGVTRPSYIAPATTADATATGNTGVIPLGARLMLPASFDATTLSTPQLRKIAQTLKLYGAYVVDRNYDTAFGIFVENGSNFKIMPNGWSNLVVADLEKIRAALREVVRVDGWIDGDGNASGAAAQPGLVSMRGAWMVQGSNSAGPGTFDSWEQSVVFPATTRKLSQINYSTGVSKVSWAKLTPGTPMRLTAVAAGGATIRMQVKVANAIVYDSGYLGNGTAVAFNWPSAAGGSIAVTMLAESGLNMASRVRGVLTVK